MGLELIQAIGGRPNNVQQAASTALLAGTGLRTIAIASGNNIELCDSDLQLKQTIPFSQAFPADVDRSVTAVLLLDEGNLIAAADGDLAVWEQRQSSWHILSSLQATGSIKAIAYARGTLVTGSDVLTVWSLDTSSRFPLWRKRFSEAYDAPVQHIALSQDGSMLAAVANQESIVHTYRIAGDSITPISEPWHPLPLVKIAWKPDNSALFTQTTDGIFRVWATMIDEPDFYALWASANHTPFAGKPSCPRPMASFWIDASSLPAGSSTDVDRLLSIFADGSIGITTIENVGRKPPTCVVQHFHVTILQAFTRQQLAYLRYPISYLDGPRFNIVGRSGKGSLLLANFAFLHSRPSIREIRRRPAGSTTSFSASGETVWRLSDAGEVTLHDAKTLATLASCETAGGRLLQPIDHDATVVITGERLQLLRRDGMKLRVAVEVEVPADVALLQLAEDQRIETIAASGASTTYSLTKDSLKILEAAAAPTNEPHLLVSIPGGSFASLDENGELSFATGKRARTRRKRPRLVAMSERMQMAIVKPSDSGEELSIWDTNESEFTSGLGYSEVFSEPISALSWTLTHAKTPVLAVALSSRILIVCKKRRRYYSRSSAWSTLSSVSLWSITPSPITSLAWSSSGSLIASTTNQLFLAASTSTSVLDEADAFSGPLPVFHPQLLQHCLLAGKAHLVDHILLALHSALAEWSAGNSKTFRMHFDLEEFLSGFTTDVRATSELGPARGQHSYAALTNGTAQDDDERAEYNDEVAQSLVATLHDEHPLQLDAEETEQLAVIAQTACDIKSHRRAIDVDGMRYLVAMRTFALTANETRQNLHFRDVLWAFHSQTQEILLQASIEACGDKMTWKQARSFGVFQWLRGHEQLASHMELVARSIYTSNLDIRDPGACSLYYFALRKRRLVHGLWKTAYGHNDRTNMLKFLINDFDEPRWRTAALKNAYVLLGKQRFELAAAFFLLGDSLTDAVNVCIRQLDDFQLAIAVARVYEGNDQGPVLKRLLETHVVPLALGEGHRWLASWAFWMLNRRDLAVRVIVTPFTDLLPDLPMTINKVGEPDTDDPALILLLARLRDWSLQTIQGASLISIKTEFNFVLYMSRILREMGCHILALDLVTSWPFTRPERKSPEPDSYASTPLRRPSALGRRRSSLLGTRQSTIVADMQIPSTVVSRSGSPEPMTSPQQLQGEPEAFKALAKQARKQVSSVAEFDMGAFGF